MGYIYIAPLYYAAVLPFLLTVNADAMRSEGHVRLMSVLAIAATLMNVAFNWVFIALFGLGVLGSALGTLAAQAVSVATVIGLRNSNYITLRFRPQLPTPFWRDWPEILMLGLPPAMNFLGVSLISAMVFVMLQVTPDVRDYQATAAAYGIITRITAFTYLPLLGFNLACQAVVGNNTGAGELRRADQTITLGLRAAFAYGISVSLIYYLAAGVIGGWFVDDELVISETKRILPVMMSAFGFSTITIMLAGYFQALGDAPRAAFLGLGRMYLCSIPLVLTLPRFLGEWGLWVGAPVGDMLMLCLTMLMLAHTARTKGYHWGLLRAGVR